MRVFTASKIGLFLATPSNGLVIAGLLGTALAVAVPSLASFGLRVALVTLLALVVLGLGPVAGWIVGPLENRFAPAEADGEEIVGVVVLGGAVHPNTSFARGQLTVGDGGERVIAMADLARRHPGARIIFSGGSGAVLGADRPEADAVARYAATLGIVPERITFENRSRTTWENAVESRALARPQPGERWLLVTSAWHMPRAVGAFRQAGFDVVPYPVDYRTAGTGLELPTSPAIASGLDLLDTGVKEWLGLAVYRLSGRSDAWFPSPSGSAPSTSGASAMR